MSFRVKHAVPVSTDLCLALPTRFASESVMIVLKRKLLVQALALTFFSLNARLGSAQQEEYTTIEPPVQPDGEPWHYNVFAGYAGSFNSEWFFQGDYAAGPNGGGEVYAFRKTIGGWHTPQRLNPGPRTRKFGWAVASNSSQIAVGDAGWGITSFNKGHVLTYSQSNGRWLLDQDIRAPADAELGDNPQFGHSLAMTDSLLAVGAPTTTVRDRDGTLHSQAGAVFLYERSGDRWIHSQSFTMPVIDAFRDEVIGFLGNSVAIRGNDTIFAGAPAHTGAVFVYKRGLSGWRRSAILENPAPLTTTDLFGFDVAVSSTTLVVGTPRHGYYQSQSQTGRAYVYEEDTSGTWQLSSELMASDGTVGKFGGNVFGESVAVHGDTVVVGAPQTLEGGDWVGAAYAFYRNETGWGPTETARYRASDRDQHTNFDHSYRLGASVETDGDFIYGGAPRALTRNKPVGKTYVFALPIGSTLDCRSTAQGAETVLVGSDQVVNSNLTVAASGLLEGGLAVVLASNAYHASTFGGSTTCLEAPRVVLGVHNVSAGGLLLKALDFNEPRFRGLLSPGGTLYVQVALRHKSSHDPAQLSDVVEVSLQ